MSGPQNQHWLPQFYLRRFAVPGFRNKKNAKIWVMDLEKCDLEVLKVKDVAAADFLYSHVKPDGSRCFKVEKHLGEMETMIARLYPRLDEGYPDLSVSWGIKKLAALFIASLMLRHPDEELATRDAHQKMVNLVDQAPKDAHGNPCVDCVTVGREEFPFDATEFNEVKAADENQIKQMFASQIRPVAAQLAEHLFKKRWVFFCCKSPVFFTSDKPVVLKHTSLQKFGVGTPGVNVWFPLSPFRMIWMSDGGDGQADGFYPFPEDDAAMMNVFIMAKATRFLLSHDNPDSRMQDVGILADKFRRGEL